MIVLQTWKKAFIWLASINAAIILLLIVCLIWLLSIPDSEMSVKNDKKLEATEPVFTVSTDKEQLTKLINQQIDSRSTGNLKFHVDMTDTVDIIGNLRWLGLNIPFQLSFLPSVSNGDISLKEESAKLGVFNLPESQVLKFIKAGGNLPEWVEVLPNEKQINVRLSQYLIKDQYYFKAKALNLAKNDITFTVHQAPSTK